MKAVVFSLFGDDLKYHEGAIANVVLCRKFYPDWTPVFFCGFMRPSTSYVLMDRGAMVLNPIYRVGGIYWRHTFGDFFPDIERYVVRDADSRIGQREVDAVNAWIDSGKTFHIMRDHPRHGLHVMQGMYGVKGNALTPMLHRLQDIPNERGMVVELFKELYETQMKYDCVEHGSFNLSEFPNQIPFPSNNGGHRFVGEIFDEYHQHNDDWKEVPEHDPPIEM